MDVTSTVDAAVEALARRQHRAFSLEQAQQLGASRSLVHRRRDAGRWLLLEPRVYVLAGSHRSREQRLMQAVLGAADGAVVSHRAAARLWRLDGVEEAPVETTVPRGRRYRRGVVVHQATSLVPSDVTRCGPFPITTATRTVVDLAAVASPLIVERAAAAALRKGQTSLVRMWRCLDALAERGRPGIAIARMVVASLAEQAESNDSDLETIAVQLLRSAGLPRPVLHHVVRAEDGFVAEVDLAYPHARLAIELDGYAVHAAADAFQHDRTRQNRLVLLRWTVIRFTWHDVVRRPEYVVATVGRALAGAVPA